MALHTPPLVFLGRAAPTFERLRAALGGLPRPLVCSCGAVEGAAAVGVTLGMVGGGWRLEAVCDDCDPSAVLLGGDPFVRDVREETRPGPGVARALPPRPPTPPRRRSSDGK